MRNLRSSPLRILSTICCFALTSPAVAQDAETEPGYLESFLEETFSSDNQYISVTGLSGALSSQASISRITVADQTGVWLEVKGAELDWNRLALLRGEFSVNRLTAAEINVLRQPLPLPADPSLTSPEATAFQLPDLPVSVELGEIGVKRIDLGPDLLGFAATLDLSGDLKLAGGNLATHLKVNRLDRPGDQLALAAEYAGDSRQIALDLALNEAAGGLISNVLSLPSSPSLRFSIAGTGPVEDFAAQIALASNGQERLAGQVILSALPQPASDGETAAEETQTGIAFTANLGGDIDPLLPADYHPFFGPDLALTLRGASAADSGLALDSLALDTQALRLTGALALTSAGQLDTANLRASITPREGQAAILLPLPGANTTVGRADLQASKSQDGPWSIAAELRQLSSPQIQVSHGIVQGQGLLTHDSAASAVLNGQIEAKLQGVTLQDPVLAQATGRDLSFSSQITSDGSAAISLQGIQFQGADYQLSGDLSIEGLQAGLKLNADLRAGAADMARFSGLAGRPLSGAMQAEIAGSFTPLSGAFDADLSLQGQGLSAGIAEMDRLTEGNLTLRFKGGRGLTGIRVEVFQLQSGQLSAEATGDLDSRAGTLALKAGLKDLNLLVPQLTGPLDLQADVSRSGNSLSGAAKLTGPHSSFADLSGSVQLDGDADFTFDATLDQLQRLLPELPGKLTALGQAQRRAGNWQISAEAQAPAGARARLQGSYDETRGLADITAKGQLRLEGANSFLSPNLLKGAASFDLALQGAPGLDALRGSVTTTGASMVLPAASQRLDDIGANVTFDGSRAQIRVAARPRDGGTLRIEGPIALLPPFDGALQIAMRDFVVTDHLSYNTSLNGDLTLAGALASNSRLSGRIDVGETNINLNTAGGSISAAAIPPIRHINETRQSRLTRARAGLIESGGGTSSSSDIALDVIIDAPNRIYARGRGLRAELGGQIHLRGSTAALAPAGQISLVRGTFDILGRRLELDEGRITLLGDLKPYLEFRSSAATANGSATLEISGQVDAPEIKVSSEPPRPSEEALALLLFGDNLDDLSPLALARLAKSALELSGRGLGATDSLRDGSGADKVDLGLDNLGSGLLGVGGYIGDKAYTDFSVNTRGDTELSINLDLSDSVTVTGTVDSQGESGVGLMFKRDY
ncbi:translocation/assembly module TamB domain-containing protein [Pseudophaeobacter sp.]|uniref:translocation/assembly module TamB domain-containing protein n=1 Tax=Pseudophaeobacter sp. TaxID=1971739 RepID=UPI00405892C4